MHSSILLHLLNPLQHLFLGHQSLLDRYVDDNLRLAVEPLTSFTFNQSKGDKKIHNCEYWNYKSRR